MQIHFHKLECETQVACAEGVNGEGHRIQDTRDTGTPLLPLPSPLNFLPPPIPPQLHLLCWLDTEIN